MAGLAQRLRTCLRDPPCAFVLALLTVSMLAFGVRLWWVLAVQPPGEAIFSDMRSYIHRAVWLLFDQQHVSRYRELDVVLFPYGTHYLHALQIWAFGLATPDLPARIPYSFAGVDFTAMAVVQALLGAAAVASAMLAARLAFRGPWGPLIVGALLVLWHPLISFTGYFTSETPFSCLVALGFWLWLRYAVTGRGAWLAGAAMAVGFTFRPQLLMTGMLGLAWVALRHRRIPGFHWRQLAWIALPILAVVVFSAARYHSFMGEFGLISGNTAIGRFFAATDYDSIEAEKKRSFHPPARTADNGFEGAFHVPGFISDAAPLDRERERVWGGKTVAQKLWTLARNVGFLAHGNRIWPERSASLYAGLHAGAERRLELERDGLSSKQARKLAMIERHAVERESAERSAWRTALLSIWEPLVLFGLVPLALFGLGLAVRRYDPALELAGLHVVTMVYAAAMYFGEARYRVPYDTLLVLLAVSGALAALRLVRPRQARNPGGASTGG